MVIKNIKYIISYVLAVLVVLLGALFYRQPVLTALLLLMLMLPVLSIVLCSRAKENLKVTFDTLPVSVSPGKGREASTDIDKQREPGNTIARNSVYTGNADDNEQDDSGFSITMRVENSGIIPLLNCVLTFRYSNRFFPDDEPNEMIFAAPSKSHESYELWFETALPGLFEFETEKIYVTDLMHLKTWEIPFSKMLRTALLPEEIEIENIEIKKSALEEDAENSLTGELSREVRQIREYAPGDRMRDMHWKQTARLDEPMVREFERMRESFFVLFPVVEPGYSAVVTPYRSEDPMTGRNEMCETLKMWFSLAMKLIKQGETIFTVIYDSDSRTLEKYRAASEDELIQTVYELYCGIEPDFRASDELIGRLREEIPDVL